MAIFKFFFQAAADLDPILGRNRNIAPVEEAVEIAPEQEAVVYVMRAVFIERLDMSRL